MIQDSEPSRPWGARQRLRSPLFYGGLVFAALIGIAGGIAADGSWAGIAILVLLMVVGTGVVVSFTLPRWPSSKSEGPMKNAVALSCAGFILLLGVLAYRSFN